MRSKQQDCQIWLTGFGQLSSESDFRVVQQQNNNSYKTSESIKINDFWLQDVGDSSEPLRQKSGRSRQQAHFCLSWTQLRYEVELELSHDKLFGTCLRRLLTCFGSSSRERQISSTSETSTKKDVEEQKPHKRIVFENLNGNLSSGELLAILGPSGAGKTSLLNAICGRTENYRGTINLRATSKGKRFRVSIIPQKDVLTENLSVRENLLFSSKILNSESGFDHNKNILRVAKALNLTGCLDSSTSKISGGEHKRVSIAQELLKQPDILILDEPTSGLDSLTCRKLIESLNKLIEASRVGSMEPVAIVMTVHQPDVEVFHMFDRVYCMARRGRIVFDGRPQDALQVVRRVSGLNDGQLRRHCNPANLLIELASGDVFGQEPIERLARFQRDEFFVATGERRQVVGDRSSLPPPKLRRDKRLNPKRHLQNSSKFWYHTSLLAKRAFRSTLRDSFVTQVSLLFHLAVPIVMWLAYPTQIGLKHGCPTIQHNLDFVSLSSDKVLNHIQNSQEELVVSIECSTMFFLTCYSLSMCSMALAALDFPLNMHILLKEARNGWYNSSCFLIGKTLANLPFQLLFPTTSIALTYVILQMPPSHLEWRFWAIAAVTALLSLLSHTQGLIFGALFMDSVQSSIFLSLALTLPQVILSGFIARINNMAYILQKLSWLSIYRYSQELIQLIRFGFQTCPCDSETEDYLRTTEPKFDDVPENLNRIIANYLLVEGAGRRMAIQEEPTEAFGSNLASFSGYENVSGVAHNLFLGSVERESVLEKLGSNQFDLLGKMANLTARSFAFGRRLESCNSVRPQLLHNLNAPPDDQLPFLFLCMFLLLVALKINLFVCVKYKIGSRL